MKKHLGSSVLLLFVTLTCHYDVCNVILCGENVVGRGYCFVSLVLALVQLECDVDWKWLPEARNKAHPLLGGGGRENRVNVVYYQRSLEWESFYQG